MKITTILTLLAVAFVPAVSFGASGHARRKPIVREERTVVINGAKETWRLQWEGTPTSLCGPEGDEWSICPCWGVAFGEEGNLTLVRKRSGKKEERLNLTDLFNFNYDVESPPSSTGLAFLPRWPVHNDDYQEKDSPSFAERVRSRPLVPIMNFADYDHDGRATEFVLQIGTEPCGKEMCIVVGVSQENPHLHAFSSIDDPKEPLALQRKDWDLLSANKGPVVAVDWACGDHGNEIEIEIELTAENGNISTKSRTYKCIDNKRAGLLDE